MATATAAGETQDRTGSNRQARETPRKSREEEQISQVREGIRQTAAADSRFSEFYGVIGLRYFAGRLQGVFIIVVAGGPRLGALYAGTLATLTALWLPPLLGGMLVIGLALTIARLTPRFRAYDALSPEA